MRSPLLAMALMRPMVAPTMGEWASIVEHIMVIPLTGMVVPAMPMERAAVRQPGTMAPGTPQVGAGAPLRGIMDREAPAVSEAARPRGVAAPGARPDGEAARSPGAAVVFTVADSGDDGRTAVRFILDKREQRDCERTFEDLADCQVRRLWCTNLGRDLRNSSVVNASSRISARVPRNLRKSRTTLPVAANYSRFDCRLSRSPE
jgi:hypothetical protein